MLNRYLTVYLCILVIIFPASVFAQQSGTIRGKIIGQDRQPIPEVSVNLSGTTITTASDSHGNFVLTGVPIGAFRLKFSKIGYQTQFYAGNLNAHDLTITQRMREADNNLEEVTARGLSKERMEVKKVVDNVMPVTVITSKEIENRAGNLNEILARQAGIQIRQSGGLGSDTKISVRGLEGKRVQVFIDGNPLNTPDGSLGINDLPLQIIERIEIYKGAVPAYLGGDGLGSAVNVIIKHRDVSYIDATASYQSYNTRNLGLILKQNFDKAGIELGLGVFDSASDNDYLMESPYQPGLFIRRDHDAYHSLLSGFSAKFHKLWFDEIELEGAYIGSVKQIQGIQRNIQFAQTDGKSGVIALNMNKTGLLNGKLAFRNNLILGRFDIRFTDTSSYSYNWDGTRTASLYGKGELGIGPNLSRTKQNEVRERFNLNYVLSKNYTLNLNNNFRYGTLDPSDDLGNSYAGRNLFNYPGDMRSNIAGLTLESRFLQDQVLISTGLKHFYNNVNGYNTNIYVSGMPDRVNNVTNQFGYTLGLRYKFSENFLAKVSHERGLRFPVNSELFGDGGLITPAIFLKPELAYNNNIGLVYDYTDVSGKRFQIEANAFYMNVDELIQLAGNGLSLGYVNYTKARITGADFDLKKDITRNLYFSLNGTWQRLTDNNKTVPGTNGVSNPTYGLTIPNIPNFFTNLNLEYHKENLLGKGSKSRIMYDGSYVERFNYGFEMSMYDDYIIPSYFIHTLSLEQSFKNSRYTITAEANNLFDARVINNYNQPLVGRTFRLKFRYLLLGKKMG